MEDFLLQTDSKDPVIFKKLQTISELCHEIFITEQEILKEFLTLLLHKYDLTLSKVDSHVSKCDVGSQTDFDVQIITSETNSWNVENIADEVASIAQKNLEESGLVYDENTGLYYDHKFQCYYNPEIKLYYSYQTGAYYFYDEESQGLKFYCNASEPSNSDTTNNDNNNAKQPEEAVKCEEISKPELTNETSNETTNQSNTNDVKENDLDGEKTIEATESDEPPNSPGPVVIEAAPKAFEPDHSKHIAPCIRVIVKSSALDKLKAGTLFIVTCMGGTLGREGDRDVLIPDVLVSKLHNSFQYVYKDGIYFYEVIDVGSKNGTFLNGKRLSDSLVKSEPVEISHGSILTVGSTDLLCHIHPKDETCQDCEPYNSLKEEVTIDLSEVSLKKKHDLEVAAIRKKFGILRYSSNSQAKLTAGYEDRSDQRRKEKGSSHPSEKTQASSVDCHIEKQNKGFVLLSKMGWVEGTPLGKSPGGITEPITVREGPPLPLGLSLHTPSSQSSVRILYMIAGRCNLERWYCVNRERHPGSFDSVPIKDSIGPTFANRLNNVFIGSKGPDV